MKRTSLAVAVALATSTSPAWADEGAVEAFEREFADVQMEVHGTGGVDLSDHPEAPSKGKALMIAGIVVGGAGVAAVFVGIFFGAMEDDVYVDVNPFHVAIGLGGVGVAGGATLLIFSMLQRSEHNDWIEQRKREQGVLDHLIVQPLPGGGGLGWQGTF
ncbi:MAG: hypothetical protein JRI68_25225 [Deltaproteobacteria bacterium]|nr:hypothetical protein [Deltaproteobacteria bacterium]